MRKSAVSLLAILTIAVPQPRVVAQGAPPADISVEMSNFKFTPSMLTLRRGQTYRLHLVNHASGGHDFSAPEFFAASTVGAVNGSAISDGTVKLAGHATVELTVTPEKAGDYALRCTHFMHSGMGMNGHIVVQ